MRKIYHGCEVAKRHRIIYSVYMSKENQTDMIRRISRDTCIEDIDEYVSHLDLCEFIRRLNDKFIFTERYEDGVRVQQMTDESGTFSYHVEGRMHSFLQGYNVIYIQV